MDPVTHALLGASVQEAGLRQKIGRDAAIAGMLAGIAPDGDIIMLHFGKVFFSDPQTALVLGHRGVTHSLAAVVIFPLIIAGGWWFIRNAVIRRKFPADRKPASFGLLYLCCMIAVIAHVLLDACTSYGTMLYWPFSSQRIAWDCVAIIDPLFMLIPAAILFICWMTRRKTGEFSTASIKRTKKVGRWGLALCAWYLLLGVALHYNVIERSIGGNDRRDIIQAGAYPVIPSLCTWRVVWETPAGWHVGKVNAFSFKPAKFTYIPRSYDPLIESAGDTEFYKAFKIFAGNMLRADVKKKGESTEVIFHDMRYGWPTDSPDGIWAYMFEYDATGRLISHGRKQATIRPNVLKRIKDAFKK